MNNTVNMMNVRVNGRWDIKLPEHRAIRPEWTSEQGWEKARLSHMYSSIINFKRKNDRSPVVYYVGAEEGDMCGLLAKWGAELVMFEPNDKVWPNIKAIWQANKLPVPALAFPGFASTKTSDPLVWVEKQWPRCADGEMIAEHGFKNLCEADGTVPEMAIDYLSNQMAPPDIISIDVEGAEWEVLRGAEQTLIEHRPTIYLSLHPEFLYEIYKEYSADLRYWLKVIGYKETLLDYQHEVHLVYERSNNDG